MNGIYWIYGRSLEPPALQPGMRGRQGAGPLVALPLAIVLCPRGGRFLEREMSVLRRAGVDILVSLLSEEQVEMLELSEEPLQARRMGMQFLHHPIPDHQLPTDAAAFRAFVSGLAERLRAGQRIGIHCWGSIGRATVTAACTLMHLGWSAEMALTAVEAARGCPVPDTEEQQRWILNYKAKG